MTSSATRSPSTFPDRARTRRSNGWPLEPNVSSREYSVSRSTASAAWTIWSTNSRLSRSMSISASPRSRPTKPMMSLRRRLSPWAVASGTKPSASITACTRWRVSACTRCESRMTRETVAVETPAIRATS